MYRRLSSLRKDCESSSTRFTSLFRRLNRLRYISLGLTQAQSKRKSRLQLEHSRRIYVCKCRKRISSSTHGYQLAKGRIHNRRIAVNSLTATKIISVIEQIESFQ